MKVKPVIMWALTLHGEVCEGWMGRRKAELIAEFLTGDWTWREARKDGYDAIQVRVVPLEK